LEIVLGAGFLFLVILPIGPLAWVAVTGLSLYVLLFTDVAASRQGASILLAVTVPMLWSRMLFHFFANYILTVDAWLVSWLLGTHRTGNLVEFFDKSGQLVIFPPCSSLANVSLALLCWVTFSQPVSHKSKYDFLWCLLACTAVVAVNVTRMTILGMSEWHYATFHNEWGDAVANVVILGLIIGICALGVRHELVQRI
jgi:exosortase/archaeosortase family protein